MTASLLKEIFRKYGLGLIVVWTCILAVFLTLILDEYHDDTIMEATREAKDYHGLNLHYRKWGSRIGGVYAAVDKVAPNPYLAVPDRDVLTDSGKYLTLVNPAYMTRMVFEAIQKESKDPIINRLVSLKPLNPSNTPNVWEVETLQLFDKKDIKERSQAMTINNKPYLQYMAAFMTEESCLLCHAVQGYRVGDVRGGMSIAIPLSGYLANEAEKTKPLFGGFALLWVVGSAGVATSSRRRYQQEVKILEEKATALDLSERYSIVADGIPSLIAHVNRDERYIYVNKAYADWIQLPREQIVGKSVLDIIGNDTYELSRPYIQGVLNGKVGNYVRHIGFLDRKITQSIDFVPQIDSDGNVVAYFALINDVTERNKLELELRERTSRLESEVFERQQIQEQLEEQALRLEEEITERQLTQEQLEEQAAMLEEEAAERQQAVVALQKAEQFLNMIIESEPECVKLLDFDCNLLLMNRAGLEMIDAESFEQVKGHCVSQLICEPYREAFIAFTRKVIQGIPGSMEFEIVGLKGRRLWMSSIAVPFSNDDGTIAAALAITRDITELKNSREALIESEDRFRGITESLADLIWEMDAHGHFTFASDSSEQLLGYTPDEIVGTSVYQYIDPHDLERVGKVFKAHARDKTPVKNLENWEIAKNGRRVCLLTNGVPILNPQGELIGYRGVSSDVTEQRMLERQASQQQKLESIGLLAGGIAHDFNNMLVPIYGYAEMINTRHASDEKTAGYSSTILKAAENAKALVSRLLSFSRKQTFNVEQLDLNGIISSFILILQRTIRENIEIQLHLCPEPCRFLADRSQIEQILLNLAVNAQDAINEIGTIFIETGHLTFDNEYCMNHPGTKPGRYVMIAFSDTGSGIDDATLPFVFDPFFTTKPVGHGTGLGLSTIFGVVKQLEGSIDVKSQKNTGTTFTLFFPEKTEEESNQEKNTALEESVIPVGTILVVEDNQMVLSMVREILEDAGHRVITKDQPVNALEFVRSCSENIDLLISDVVMPQMNGPELYDRIIEHRPGLKVLFMSGYAGVITAHGGHLEEEANYISKPFSMEGFRKKVAEIMCDDTN